MLGLDRDGDDLSIVERHERKVGPGPIQVERIGSWVVVGSVLSRTLCAYRLGEEGFPGTEEPFRIVHDGPFWGFSTARDGSDLWIAAGGVEDRPLDRSDGTFGHVDSFAYLYRVDADGPRRAGEIDLSDSGIHTPKWLSLSSGGEGSLQLHVAGYGGDRWATIAWSGLGGEPSIETFPAIPGIIAASAGPDGWVAADPLLDCWVVLGESSSRIVAISDRSDRSVASRLGEVLFFTDLMAPWNSSTGRASRFTCETCHFEGYVDGRTHHTGRGEVRATTKPLRGLYGNRPHFSRALDPTMTAMVFNEFEVAGRGSGRSAWFALDRSEFPWLGEIEGLPARIEPVELRRALMEFLVEFSHVPNPATRGRSGFDDLENRGAELFRDSCETCHEARLVADDPSTRVPYPEWEKQVFDPASSIVWGRDGYERTGVEPYVHERGARVPSLRRLYKKRPYFTGGGAGSLDELLEQVAFEAGRFFHRGRPGRSDLERLREWERVALAAFLDLL